MLSALLDMKASEVSSRGRLHGRMVPGTIHVGTSFMLCTQMSTSLFWRAQDKRVGYTLELYTSSSTLLKVQSTLFTVARGWVGGKLSQRITMLRASRSSKF